MIDKIPGFEDMVIYEDAKCAFKGDTLIDLAKKFNLHYFVETGTYAGEMLKYILPRHEWVQLYSVELGQRLFERAVKLFVDNPNIWILQGDSGEVLKTLDMPTPTLYWLDAHACGGVTAMGKKITPIIEELETVVNDVDHVIVIDDVDNYISICEPDNLPKWNVTLSQIMDYVHKRKPSLRFKIVDTMLICTPGYMP